MEAEATPKTDAQLQAEVAGLFREIGVRVYSAHLLEREVEGLKTQLFAANVELHNRRQARAAVEAEVAAASAVQAPAVDEVSDVG